MPRKNDTLTATQEAHVASHQHDTLPASSLPAPPARAERSRRPLPDAPGTLAAEATDPVVPAARRLATPRADAPRVALAAVDDPRDIDGNRPRKLRPDARRLGGVAVVEPAAEAGVERSGVSSTADPGVPGGCAPSAAEDTLGPCAVRPDTIVRGEEAAVAAPRVGERGGEAAAVAEAARGSRRGAEAGDEWRATRDGTRRRDWREGFVGRGATAAAGGAASAGAAEPAAAAPPPCPPPQAPLIA